MRPVLISIPVRRRCMPPLRLLGQEVQRRKLPTVLPHRSLSLCRGLHHTSMTPLSSQQHKLRK